MANQKDLSHKIPTVAVQVGKQQGIAGVAVQEGQTWADLSEAQRRQYFMNLEQRWKARFSATPGSSESFSRG